MTHFQRVELSKNLGRRFDARVLKLAVLKIICSIYRSKTRRRVPVLDLE